MRGSRYLQPNGYLNTGIGHATGIKLVSTSKPKLLLALVTDIHHRPPP